MSYTIEEMSKMLDESILDAEDGNLKINVGSLPAAVQTLIANYLEAEELEYITNEFLQIELKADKQLLLDSLLAYSAVNPVNDHRTITAATIAAIPGTPAATEPTMVAMPGAAAATTAVVFHAPRVVASGIVESRKVAALLPVFISNHSVSGDYVYLNSQSQNNMTATEITTLRHYLESVGIKVAHGQGNNLGVETTIQQLEALQDSLENMVQPGEIMLAALKQMLALDFADAGPDLYRYNSELAGPRRLTISDADSVYSYLQSLGIQCNYITTLNNPNYQLEISLSKRNLLIRLNGLVDGFDMDVPAADRPRRNPNSCSVM